MFTEFGSFKRPKLKCMDASRTKQEFLRDSQIGSILEKFKVTGYLNQPNANRPQMEGYVFNDLSEAYQRLGELKDEYYRDNRGYDSFEEYLGNLPESEFGKSGNPGDGEKPAASSTPAAEVPSGNTPGNSDGKKD